MQGHSAFPRVMLVFGFVTVVGSLAVTNAASDESSESAGTGSHVELAESNWQMVEKAIAVRKGRVVVLNLWTTTCGTCVEELPKFAKLRTQWAADRVAMMTVACDYDGIPDKPPQFYRERVQKKLQETKAATLENFLLTVPFVDFLEEQKLRSTPAVLVFGTDGKLVRRFDNDAAKKSSEEFTMDDVARLVSAELNR